MKIPAHLGELGRILVDHLRILSGSFGIRHLAVYAFEKDSVTVVLGNDVSSGFRDRDTCLENFAGTLQFIQGLLDLSGELQLEQHGGVVLLQVTIPVRSASAEDIIVKVYPYGVHLLFPEHFIYQ